MEPSVEYDLQPKDYGKVPTDTAAALQKQLQREENPFAVLESSTGDGDVIMFENRSEEKDNNDPVDDSG